MVDRLAHTIEIDTSADYDFLYEGLSRQNIDFHQATAELIDNAISAKQEYFTIEILLKRSGDDIEITVADDGKGISQDDLKERVLRLGGRGSAKGILNEHGFGLKNSLCLLTGNKRDFTILTATDVIGEEDYQYCIRGPFQSSMRASLCQDIKWNENLVRCKSKTGTRIIASTTFDYLRTVYPRASKLETLAIRLSEHIGVFYRHWLREPRNQIWIRYKDGNSPWIDILVPAIELPLSDDYESYSIDVQVDGVKAHARYVVGQLDERRTEGNPPTFPLEIYYKHTEKTQGIDIVVRNKVILTHQFEELWPDQVRRRERNYFIGELILEGGEFSTVNNKTGLDPHNKFWIAVRDKLNTDAKYLPPEYSIGRSEAAIKDNLVDLLESFHEKGSKAYKDYPVWSGAGVKADIVHIGPSNSWMDVYEVKDEKAGPQDVYQLIMYWDGLVNDGKKPRRGRLVAESTSTSVDNLINHWNKRTDISNSQYNIEFKSINDLGIRLVKTGKKVQRAKRNK